MLTTYAGNTAKQQQAQQSNCAPPIWPSAAPTEPYSGLTTDATNVSNLAFEAADYAERLLVLLDKSYMPPDSDGGAPCSSRILTVRDYLSHGLDRLRTTTERLSRLIQVVQD